MPKLLTLFAVIAVGTTLVWWMPLVSITRLNTAPEELDAGAIARVLWDDQLVRVLDDAHAVGEVLLALQNEPQGVKERYGITSGLGRGYLLLVKGSGFVETSDDKVSVRLGTESIAQIQIVTGPIFGNTIRDATGIADDLNSHDSQFRNDLSAQLNAIVEQQVLPLVAELKTGDHVEFVGCVSIANAARVPDPLPVIPLRIVQP
jgi:hypothetical protein